jgi:hypothetical protein
MLITEEAYGLLRSPTYMEILLCIIRGRNYAMAISKELRKRQPTVTEQLKELERVGLVKALKRTQAQSYEVNWDMLLSLLYDIMELMLETRKEYMNLSKNERALIEKTSLHGIVPKDFFEGFLVEYLPTYTSFAVKAKGFDEIIFSFFGAIDRMDPSQLKRLTRSFRINEEILSIVARAVGFELYGTELTALQGLIDALEKGKKVGKF